MLLVLKTAQSIITDFEIFQRGQKINYAEIIYNRAQIQHRQIKRTENGVQIQNNEVEIRQLGTYDIFDRHHVNLISVADVYGRGQNGKIIIACSILDQKISYVKIFGVCFEHSLRTGESLI